MASTWFRRLSMPLALIAGIALLILAASVRAAPAQQQATVIEMRDNFFQPAQVTVRAGTTVTWRNMGQRPHTATASNNAFNTGTVNPGAEMSVTLNTPGTYDYFCQFHDGMVGSIVVEAAQAQPSPAASPAPATPAGPTPSMEASDQPLVNNTITVARVVAAQDGWVAVHTNTAENKPGPVIGQAQVRAGENRNVRIQLSQTPQAGDKLWPMLHIDAGQLGVYEFPGPDGPVQANGQVVMVQITITGGQPAAPAPAASPAPAAGQPRALPETGAATDLVLPAVSIALVLLFSGALIAVRLTRRRA